MVQILDPESLLNDAQTGEDFASEQLSRYNWLSTFAGPAGKRSCNACHVLKQQDLSLRCHW